MIYITKYISIMVVFIVFGCLIYYLDNRGVLSMWRLEYACNEIVVGMSESEVIDVGRRNSLRAIKKPIREVTYIVLQEHQNQSKWVCMVTMSNEGERKVISRFVSN